MKKYGDIDSKFRYVILASRRAKQLLKGAKPKIKSRSKNLIRVAQEEVERGLIGYEIVQKKQDEVRESGDEMFIGEELGREIEHEEGFVPGIDEKFLERESEDDEDIEQMEEENENEDEEEEEDEDDDEKEDSYDD
ncbi:MAG: DNA-directed RNA polymerase subunit omega [Candidatus Aminicenantes bacterium]|nr:DNA-directed RNA polymerase subunit omega [Candidatus Aminicenantes bacterium]